MKNNQKGFGLVEGLFICAVVLIVGGFVVYRISGADNLDSTTITNKEAKAVLDNDATDQIKEEKSGEVIEPSKGDYTLLFQEIIDDLNAQDTKVGISESSVFQVYFYGLDKVSLNQGPISTTVFNDGDVWNLIDQGGEPPLCSEIRTTPAEFAPDCFDENYVLVESENYSQANLTYTLDLREEQN